MRTSSYNIFSRKQEGTGKILVLNGIIGSMDLVSADIAEELENFDDVTTSLPKPISGYFLDRGYLTEKTPDEEAQLLFSISDAIHSTASKYPHFLILPQMDCNFRCTYCYEKPRQKVLTQKNAHNKSIENDTDKLYEQTSVMSRQTIDNAFSAIKEVLGSDGIESYNPEVILYGGEPLDARIEDQIRYIVKKGEELGFTFGAVSNGYDIPVFIDLFTQTKINNIQITLDGPEEIHDKRRIVLPSTRARGKIGTAQGGSFETIVRNVDRLLHETDVSIALRINTDASTLPGFERLFAIIMEHGWLEMPKFMAYASITYNKDERGHICSDFSQNELYQLLRSYSLQHSRFLVLGHTGNRGLMLKDAIARGNPAPIRSVFCGANKGMYLFAPDGLIYSCWESVWSPEFAIGSFEKRGNYELSFNESKDIWFGRHAALIPTCLNCRYAQLCGGGCSIYAYYNSGDKLLKIDGNFYSPFCDSFQEWYPDALMDLYEEALSDGIVPLPKNVELLY